VKLKEIKEMIESSDFFATSGVKARIFCHRARITPEATTGAVEKALLRAWHDKRCLVLTDNVEKVRRELKDYISRLGFEVEIEIKG